MVDRRKKALFIAARPWSRRRNFPAWVRMTGAVNEIDCVTFDKVTRPQIESASAAFFYLGHIPWLRFMRRHGTPQEIVERLISIQNDLDKRGVPVYNRVEAAIKANKATQYNAFTRAGVPCAPFRYPVTLEELRSNPAPLEYPIIVRSNRTHVGTSTYLARNPEELSLAENVRDLIAIQFREKAGAYYEKKRAFVVGTQVFPWHHLIGSNWCLHAGNRRRTPEASRIQTKYELSPVSQRDLCLRAVRSLGLDVAAVDYSVDDSPIVYEVQIYHGMSCSSTRMLDRICKAIKRLLLEGRNA